MCAPSLACISAPSSCTQRGAPLGPWPPIVEILNTAPQEELPQKKQPQAPENKLEERTHSGAGQETCLSPGDGAVAGGRLESLHQLNSW